MLGAITESIWFELVAYVRAQEVGFVSKVFLLELIYPFIPASKVARITNKIHIS